MRFDLNNEKATLLLMWWLGSTNGSVDYKEDDAINEMLNGLSFNPYDYYSETKMYLTGLSTLKRKELIEKSIQQVQMQLPVSEKEKVLKMMRRIVESQHIPTKNDELKLSRIEKGLQAKA